MRVFRVLLRSRIWRHSLHSGTKQIMRNPEQLQITKGPDAKEQLTENAVMMETEDAKFRILYAIHTIEQTAE